MVAVAKVMNDIQASMFKSPHSLMFFVPDVQAAAEWYSKLVQQELRYLLPDFPVIDIAGIELCFHKADAKVQTGTAGSVCYWNVTNLDEVLERAVAMGAELYRGPLAIEEGLSICQFKDPFGNLMGLTGKRRMSEDIKHLAEKELA